MKELKDMPNIGNELEKLLKSVGINTPEELIAEGAKNTFLQIKVSDNTACFSKLCALQGAIMNIRWRYLPVDVRDDLKKFFNRL